jgi:predicted TIM-barrel fold metal-dependent hydrolase
MSGDRMDRSSVQRTLDLLKEIKGSNTFYDLHVHPFEVMYAPLAYHPSSDCKGLFSAGSMEYIPPETGAMNLQKREDRAAKEFGQDLRAKVALLNSRRIYAHTGPKVLAAQMDLCAIDRSLLLPIMGEEETGVGPLRLMREMFGDDDRFLFGYCLPNNIPNDKVADNVNRVVDEYGVKALKIHPAVTGIDLSSQAGRDRVEAILDASKKAKLKVVIHGGKSPECENRHAVSYGTLDNLQHIDWSITPETVVIAHSGCYGHSASEVQETALPIIDRLLERHPHLVVDTSGIGFEVLCKVLQSIDAQRIVFGSDSLYEAQWASMLRLWCALEQTSIKPEDHLLQIVSINPTSFFNVENGPALIMHGQTDIVVQTAGSPASCT